MTTRLLEENRRHRAAVVRKVIIHGPPAIVMGWLTVLALFTVLSGQIGALWGLTIGGAISFALWFESIAALRDLRASPVTTSGDIQRTWTKARMLFFGRVRYLLVEGRVFEVHPVAFSELEAEDTVEVVHWPHTNVLVTLRLLERRREREPERRPSPVPPPPPR